jgi:hypothetical protein
MIFCGLIGLIGLMMQVNLMKRSQKGSQKGSQNIVHRLKAISLKAIFFVLVTSMVFSLAGLIVVADTFCILFAHVAVLAEFRVTELFRVADSIYNGCSSIRSCSIKFSGPSSREKSNGFVGFLKGMEGRDGMSCGGRVGEKSISKVLAITFHAVALT